MHEVHKVPPFHVISFVTFCVSFVPFVSLFFGLLRHQDHVAP